MNLLMEKVDIGYFLKDNYWGKCMQYVSDKLKKEGIFKGVSRFKNVQIDDFNENVDPNDL